MCLILVKAIAMPVAPVAPVNPLSP